SIFNVNLPLGILALFVGSIYIFDRDKSHDAEGSGNKSFDGLGMALLVVGIGCLQYMLERGDSEDWFASKLIASCAILTVTCLPTFIWWELKVKDPIINMRLFRDGIVQSGVMMQALLGFFLYGVVFLLPIFAGRVFHYDATQIGLLFIPGSLVTAAMMPFIGRMMQKGVNPKALIAVGVVCVELALMLLTLLSPLSSRTELMYMLYMRGLAMAFLFVPINSSILSQFSGAALGQVSGLLNLFRQIGGSIGIALVATLLARASHQNYLDLSSRVSLLKPLTQSNFSQSVSGIGSRMSEAVGMGTPRNAALMSLYYRMQNQVFMMSFNQLVWVIAIIFGLIVIPLWRLKLRFVVKPVDSH
ncbi:MAG: MFS transporter, partial [Bdellovibrionota bacterium]